MIMVYGLWFRVLIKIRIPNTPICVMMTGGESVDTGQGGARMNDCNTEHAYWVCVKTCHRLKTQKKLEYVPWIFINGFNCNKI